MPTDDTDEWTSATPSYDEYDREAYLKAFAKSSQSKKKALIFGSVNQSLFYKACAVQGQHGITIIEKFQQSGFNGFLPFSDPGVCKYMSQDFAQAVTEGRYEKWKETISKTDKDFIARLRSGQYDAMDEYSKSKYRLGADRKFGPSTESKIEEIKDSDKKMSNFDMANLAESIYKGMSVGNLNAESSCMEAPCLRLRMGLTRTGLTKSEFSHDTMFTISVDSNTGRIDKEHLLFMDPNTGIFKIKNDEATIQKFLGFIDNKLLHQMQVRHATVMRVSNTSLPEKESPQWNERDEKIKAGQAPDHPDNYSMSKLCQLDEYLRTQISRLEANTMIAKIKKLLTNDTSDKLHYLKEVREKLHKNIKLKENSPEQLFKSTLEEIDTKKLGQKRGLGKSESLTAFKKFKEKYQQETSSSETVEDNSELSRASPASP